MSRTKQTSAIRNLLPGALAPESISDFIPKLKFGGEASLRAKGTEALTELYRENESLVRAVIFQIAGEQALDDLVQEAFIKIWKGWADFRGEAKVSSWIYRVSVNVALDHARREARTRDNQVNALETESLSSNSNSEASPEKEIASRDLVAKGLRSLSEEHRAVLVLSFLHDLPVHEVASLLDVAEGTVKSRLHFAKAQFRQFLEKKGVKV